VSQAFDWDFDSLPPEHPLRQGSVEGPRSATDLSRLAPLPPVVGRYEVLERLGQGGMATVYRARETTSGHEVALKVMLPGGKVERMLREGRVAQRLRHAGILPVYDVGEVGGRPFLVYRLVPGARTLEDVLPGVGLRRGVELIRDVAAALAHAHRQGVVHRDVKFENVLVDVDERVLVGDFGLGLPLDLGGERLTRSGAVLGTPLFMAPELLEGDRDAQGPWTDVWSLGVMLYTLLSGGAYPHPGPGLLALLDQVRRPRRELRTQHPELERICRRALEPDPRRRYPSAQELFAELEAYLAGRTVATPRRWGLLALAFAAAAAGIAALALLANRGEPDPTPPPPAVTPPPGPLPRLVFADGPRCPGLPVTRAPASGVVVSQVRLTANVEGRLLRLGVRPTGTIDERVDLGPLELVHDGDGDGRLGAQDSRLGTPLVLGDGVRGSFDGLDLALPAGQPVDLLLVADVRETATIGDTVAFRVEGWAARAVDAQGKPFELSSGSEGGVLQVVGDEPPRSVLAASGTQPPDVRVRADARRVPMLALQLSSPTGDLDMHGLYLRTQGSGHDRRDVLEARVGVDTNRDGLLQEDEVGDRSRPDADDGWLVFNLWGPRLFADRPLTLLVDYSLAGCADPGATFSLRLEHEGGLNIHAYAGNGGQSLRLPEGPVQGALLTVDAASPTLGVEAVGPAARLDPGGLEAPALTLELRGGATPVALRSLRVQAYGTLDDAGVRLGLRLDADGDGRCVPERDPELAPAQRFAADDGELTFQLEADAARWGPGGVGRLFVTATLPESSSVGQTLALRLDPTRDLRLEGGEPLGLPLEGALLICGPGVGEVVQPDRALGKDVFSRSDGLLINDNFGRLGLVVGHRPAGQNPGQQVGFLEFPLPAGAVPQRAYLALFQRTSDGAQKPVEVEVARVVPSGVRTPWIEGRGGLDPTLDGLVANGSFRVDRPELSAPDVDPTPLARHLFPDAARSTEGWVVFDVTAAARAWYTGEAENHGLRLGDANPAVLDGGSAYFWSSDTHLARRRPLLLLVR